MAEKELYAKIWNEYERGLRFHNQINLNETVSANENFFIGKQWEGVEANGLPTPVFNFLKRVVLFTVASITSDNIKMQATPLKASGEREKLNKISDVVNAEFDSLFERNKIGSIIREYMRNAAVDGDGCTYTYWDADVETGQEAKGAIVTEIVENNRVFFGNPNDRRVQKQPYIIISSREMVESVKKRAPKGVEIQPDTDERNVENAHRTDDKVTVLLKMWKNDKTGTIWACECTKTAVIRESWNMELRLYPVTWTNWDYVQDNYHGMAMITGLIPNQIFINKLFAMSMISLMTTAYPKIVYDKTRVPKWDNRVGAAIGVAGGDVNNVAKIIDPAQISPQIAQFIQLAIDYTQTFLGATSVALGDTRPDNTSAIIALQRAAAVPNEITKQNLYQAIEDLGRIYIDFMAGYYGRRTVETEMPEGFSEVAQFAGMAMGQKIPMEFDFSELKGVSFSLKLDVGASSYWSEIASMQTLDNLLMQGKIELADYLERVPDGYISKKQELLDKLKGMQEALSGGGPGVGGAGGALPGGIPGAGGMEGEIPETAGYSQLQRKINQAGM